MLFMKGTKIFPQCGFSNMAVQILNAIGADFETYQAAGGSACEAYDSCAPTLKDPVCDTDWGSTVGCECGGRAVDTTNSVVMAATDVTEARDIQQGRAKAQLDGALNTRPHGRGDRLYGRVRRAGGDQQDGADLVAQRADPQSHQLGQRRGEFGVAA